MAGDLPRRLAFLGPPGTFSEQAAQLAGQDGATLLPLASMPAVVTAVETRAADAGVLPIENSLEGAVSTTLDVLIHETDLRIQREIVIPIRHMLACRAGLQLQEIAVLHTHPQPLGQSRRFVERCLPNVATVAALSTAAALQEALADQRPAAALTTLLAAERAGAHLLARDVQDSAANLTRFVVLAHSDAPPTGRDKTSLAIRVRHNRAGALHEALGLFAAASINLTKIESRPAKGQLGDYVFLIDLEGHRRDEPVAAVLRELERLAAWVKVFGSYVRDQGSGVRGQG
ncbi:MAG TPA: prephenate dehydratase [Herpetosiphonaceae bacterium]